MTPTPLPKYGTTDGDDVNLLEGQQANGEAQQNSLTKLVTAFAVHAHVIARQDSPPGSVVESAVYMVGDTPSGDWSAFDTDDLAVGLDGAWHELDPFDGLSITREDLNNARFAHNGTGWLEDPCSSATGITASTTQSQGQQPLTTRVNNVATVGTSGDVVTLPAAEPGLWVVVRNSGANSMQVFPASGDAINALGTDAAISIAASTTRVFFGVSTTLWVTIHGAGS